MGVLKPRTATVTLYHGDDLERLAELRREVAFIEHRVEQMQDRKDATEATPMRIDDDREVPESDLATLLAEQERAEAAYDAFVDEAADRAIAVRLQAIGSLRFNDLVCAHEPRTELTEDGKRQTVADDVEYGVNMTTFPRALLTFHDEESGRRTIAGPDEVLAEMPDFVDDMSAGDLERIFQAAYWLNRARGIDPKATTFSSGSQRSPEN